MSDFTVPRTGLPAIKSIGEQLGHVTGKNFKLCAKRSRWHEIAIYRTSSSRYIVHVAFKCTTEHDLPNDQARVFDSPIDAAAFLWEFDCTAAVRGWPLDRHAAEDSKLREALENCFDQMVAELCVKIPDFAVRVA